MSEKRFAVFDIDGTLVRWQLFHAMVDQMASAGLLGETAKDELREARLRWKKREHMDAYPEYEHSILEIFVKALPTIDTAYYDRLVKTVVEEHKEQVYTYTRDLIRELKKKDYTIFAISGSQKELVQAVTEYYGFDDFIGSDFYRDAANFTGKGHIASKDKKAELATLIKRHDLSLEGSYAVGDSLSDASMLAMVENPIAFNPDIHLYERAKKEKWKIVVERKNVVYELGAKDGSYVLA